MKKHFYVVILAMTLCGVLFMSPAVQVHAKSNLFSFTASKQAVSEKDEVRITVDASNDVAMQNVAGFRLTAQYDQSRFTLKRVDTSNQIENNAFRYYVTNAQMTGIYVCNGIEAPKLTGNCFTLIFDVNEGASLGDSAISVCVDQLVDGNANALNDVSAEDYVMEVQPLYNPQAVLTKLTPSDGTLDPGFASDITSYNLNVDGAVSQIFFNTAAADDGIVKVSRKDLGKMGSSTPVTITVTSSNGKTKTQYLVMVNRGAKAGITGTSTTTNTASAKKSTTTKTTTSSKVGTTSGITPNGTTSAAITGTTYYGDRNLYMMGNEMPWVFFFIIMAGMMTAVAIPVGIWYIQKRKGKKEPK